jgi:hypothetical protein
METPGAPTFGEENDNISIQFEESYKLSASIREHTVTIGWVHFY